MLRGRSLVEFIPTSRGVGISSSISAQGRKAWLFSGISRAFPFCFHRALLGRLGLSCSETQLAGGLCLFLVLQHVAEMSQRTATCRFGQNLRLRNSEIPPFIDCLSKTRRKSFLDICLWLIIEKMAPTLIQEADWFALQSPQ